MECHRTSIIYTKTFANNDIFSTSYLVGYMCLCVYTCIHVYVHMYILSLQKQKGGYFKIISFSGQLLGFSLVSQDK